MRLWFALLLVLGVAETAAVASEPIVAMKQWSSATKARDINGFALGAPIKQATKRLKISFARGELVQASAGGIAYDPAFASPDAFIASNLASCSANS